MLERRILDAFEDFGKDFLKSCSQEELAASIPVTVRKKQFKSFFTVDFKSQYFSRISL